MQEPEVGQRATRTLAVDRGDVQTYAEITGDRDPLHFDERFAAATPFARRMVQGGITAGILNALAVEDLPGPGTVFMSQQLECTAPVFIGDTIVDEVDVLEVHATKPVTRLEVENRRPDGDDEPLVLRGEAWRHTFAGPSSEAATLR